MFKHFVASTNRKGSATWALRETAGERAVEVGPQPGPDGEGVTQLAESDGLSQRRATEESEVFTTEGHSLALRYLEPVLPAGDQIERDGEDDVDAEQLQPLEPVALAVE